MFSHWPGPGQTVLQESKTNFQLEILFDFGTIPVGCPNALYGVNPVGYLIHKQTKNSKQKNNAFQWLYNTGEIQFTELWDFQFIFKCVP